MTERRASRWVNLLSSTHALVIYAGCLYFIFALGSIYLTRSTTFATIWASNSIMLIFIFRSNPDAASRYVLSGMLANVAANYISGTSLAMSMAFGMINAVEMFIPAFFYAKQKSAPIDNLLFATIYGCIVSAALAALLISSTSNVDYAGVLFSWMSADAMAVLAILPVGMAATKENIKTLLQRNNIASFVGILCISVLVTIAGIKYTSSPFILISLPLLYGAFRLNFLGTAVLCLSDTLCYLLIVAMADSIGITFTTNAVFSNGYFFMSMTLISPLLMSLMLERKDYYRHQLHESESRWQFALSSGGQGVWDWNAVTGKVFYSRAWKTMLGYDEKSISDDLSEWSSRVHPDDYDYVMREIKKHFDGASDEYVSEHRLRCKDGSYKWILDRGKIIEKSEDSKPLRVIGTHTDIDVIKKYEKEREQLTERLLLSIDAGKIGLFELDLVKNILVWDDRMHELYGVSRDQFTHDYAAWERCVHPDDLGRVKAEYDAAVQGKSVFDTQFRIVLQHGAIRYIRAKAKVMRQADGQPLKIFGLNSDVSKEAELTNALQIEKHRLSTTLYAIRDSVVVADVDGYITFLNPAAELLLGVTQESALHKKLNEVCRLTTEKTGALIDDPIMSCLMGLEANAKKNEAVLLTQSGGRYAVELVASLLHSNRDVMGCVLVIQDVTVARHLQKELTHQATHDLLTGLMNRREFESRLKNMIEDERSLNESHVVCYLDLDRFKIVNDSAGHEAGDELLRRIGKMIAAKIRATDVVARLGGDEFSLILPRCPVKVAVGVVEGLIQAFKEFKFVWKDSIYEIGVSVGIVSFTPGETTLEKLLANADAACYAAKNQGGNVLSIYNHEAADAILLHEEIQLVADIERALDAGRFTLHAHEIRPMQNGVNHHSHYEMLVRMIHENGHIIMPGKFISVAERHGLMTKIDEWVIRELLQTRGQEISERDNFSFSINLSVNSITSPSFLAFLREQLATTPIKKHQIGFELTEKSIITDRDKSGEFLQFIESQGCFVLLDDFGAGLSSFGYLKHFPMKYIKIDGSLIRNIATDEADKAIVMAIHDLAHKMNAKTIAEFVETPAIAAIVREIGIDYAQGDAIGKAESLASLFVPA